MGPDHPDVAIALDNLATFYKELGQFPQAETLYLRSIKIREAKLGFDHPLLAHSPYSPNGFNADLYSLLNSPDTAVPGQTYNHFVSYSSNSSAIPTLGQVRGKIVFVPSTDNSWGPIPNPQTGQQIGWQPSSEVDQNSHAITDPNTRWNYGENDNGANDSGLIPTDLGNPNTLYRNNLTQDNTTTTPPVGLGDAVNAIAQAILVSSTRRHADDVGLGWTIRI